ncbi:MAG: two-component regulator propeller domain-containing protein [Candidatus Latescibacterota bacterium]
MRSSMRVNDAAAGGNQAGEAWVSMVRHRGGCCRTAELPGARTTPAPEAEEVDMADYRGRSGARRGHTWLSCLAAAAAWAAMCLPAPLFAQEAREWEVYTPTGVERRAYPAPTTINVGLPEPVEVPSGVTGTGQGRRLTDVEVVVVDGAGGKPAPGPAGQAAEGFAEDREGNIWITTDGVLSRFDGQQWTTFTREDGLPGDMVGDLLVDRQGRLWVTGSGGIARSDGQRWVQSRVHGWANGGGMALAPNGDVWFAGGGRRDPQRGLVGLLFRFDGQDWWEYGPDDGIPFPGSTLWAAVDRAGVVWTAITWTTELSREPPPYELTSFDGQRWVSYDVPEPGRFDQLYSSMHAAASGEVWLNASNQLLRFDGHAWTRYTGGPGAR